MKNYVLTDFSDYGWDNIDINSVIKELNVLNEKANVCLVYGELGHPISWGVCYDKDDFRLLSTVALRNASHMIENLSIKDNKIYGDVTFLESDKGQIAKRFVEEFNYRFGIRAITTSTDPDNITFHKIITWDVIKPEASRQSLKKRYK